MNLEQANAILNDPTSPKESRWEAWEVVQAYEEDFASRHTAGGCSMEDY